jgi:multimeric flavodoxin WrbA
MSNTVIVVYHSGYGHTQKQAEAVAKGADSVDGVSCTAISVEELQDEKASGWSKLDEAAAIIFGSPTYMGSASAQMKAFMDATSGRWMKGQWAEKLAAGFTNSGSQNGDKQNTLIQFATLAAQHGMVWINLNVPPGNNNSKGSLEDLNRLGSSLGAMAQSDVDVGPDNGPIASDLATARALGERVSRCVIRWNS